MAAGTSRPGSNKLVPPDSAPHLSISDTPADKTQRPFYPSEPIHRHLLQLSPFSSSQIEQSRGQMLVYADCGDESSVDKASIGLKFENNIGELSKLKKSRLWRPSPHIGFISRQSNTWLREVRDVVYIVDIGYSRSAGSLCGRGTRDRRQTFKKLRIAPEMSA